MRRLLFQVAVGEKQPLYERCIESAVAYCERHGIDHIVLRSPVLKIRPKDSKRSEGALRLGYLPIFEKENAFAYLGEYDEIAIVDADVYIRPSAPNIFDELKFAAFAGVIEHRAPITEKYRRKINGYSRGQYGEASEFFNMGVMVITKAILPYLQGQTPREFIERPEFEAFVNGEGAYKWSTDQTLLNHWVRDSRMPTQVLDWRWNGLYGGVLPARIKEAHFVHFFLMGYLTKGIDALIAGIEG